MARWLSGWSRSRTSNTASKSGDLTQRVEGVHMATRSDDLKDRLSRYREINISVTGRKSGRAISRPVWFVLEGDKLYLLPVQGRIHSGTRTCSTSRRFGSALATSRLDSRLFRSLTPHGYHLW